MRKKLLIGSLATMLVVAGGGAYALAASGGAGTGFSFLTDLAGHLGLPVATVKTALQQTEIDKVNSLLKAGKITSQQATQMEQAINSGKFPVGGMGFGMHRHGPGMMGMGLDLKAASTYLGVSMQQLMTDLQGGQTLAQVATAQGKTAQGLEQALTTAFQTRLQTAVTNGHMTQQQANTALSRFQSNVSQMINGTMKGPWGHGWGPPPQQGSGSSSGSQGA